MNTTVEGQWTWDDTCAVMKDLRASGVECGESVGGVWIMFDLESQDADSVQRPLWNG
jgi:hypothetical protein